MLCFPVSFGFGMLCMMGYYLFAPAWREVMEQARVKDSAVLSYGKGKECVQ